MSFHVSTLNPHSNRNPRRDKSAAYAPLPTVLHLYTDLESGKAGRDIVTLATQSQREGWRAVLATAGNGALTMQARRASVGVENLPLNQRGLLAAWRSRRGLDAVIRRERPTLLHAHAIGILPQALRLQRVHTIPLLWDLTHPLTDLTQTERVLAKFRRTHSLVRVPSRFMADYVAETLHIPHDRIALVPPGIDAHRLEKGGVTAERLRNLSHAWRLPEPSSVLLMPMPLQPGLGHDLFLQALVPLRDEGLFAVMVGDDRSTPGFREHIEKRIEELGLQGKVIMPTTCTDWAAACWLASVVIAPNVAPMGQNIEILTAQAAGRPVIVTEVGANPEMVRSGETAWVVRPDDANALTEALREAVALNATQREKLGAIQHDFITEAFPQNLWIEGILDLYGHILTPNHFISHHRPSEEKVA